MNVSSEWARLPSKFRWGEVAGSQHFQSLFAVNVAALFHCESYRSTCRYGVARTRMMGGAMNTLQGEALREPLGDGTLAEAMYLYDQKRKKPQPIYSRRIIGLLAVIGVLGIAATGFLGYPSDTSVLYTIFHPPWLLFAWFAAAILLTQRALFRQRNLIKWRSGTFIVTLVCIAGIATSYVWPDVVKDLTNGIVAVFSAIGIPLGKGRLVVSAVNFGLIALYI